MKTKIKFILSISLIILLMQSCSKSLIHKNVINESQCNENNGYWYNNECWKDYKDEGISETEIDEFVAKELEIIEKSKFVMDNNEYPLLSFMPLEEGKYFTLVTVYGLANNHKTLVIRAKSKDLETGILNAECMLFTGDANQEMLEQTPDAKGTANIKIVDIANLEFEIDGELAQTSDKKKSTFRYKTNAAIIGAGSSEIEIKGNEAYLSGDLGTRTYGQVKNLLKNNPEVKTILMTQISGSVNDAVNMHTGRLVHENGFTTKVLKNSQIASGGVDLFCAGVNRIVEKGAKIGVHSWCCVNNLTAIDIPKTHPAHKYQLEYFTMALGKEKGPDFYFYTLKSAAFNSIHFMSDEEIKEWTVATKFIEN